MLAKHHHVHFVGIGGIGMSALATILRKQKYIVSGCDKTTSSIILDQLKNLGCTIYQGHDTHHLHTVDRLVVSGAISKTNPEITNAIKKNIPILHRAQLLAHLVTDKKTIAITGTHGKTTTTSLIAHVLIEARKDPTVIAGGIISTFNSNAQLGTSNLAVVEADESDRSLLSLNPWISVLTNIEYEHVNTYQNIDDLKQTLIKFLNNTTSPGQIFACVDDPHIQDLLPHLSQTVQTFGFYPFATIRGKIINPKQFMPHVAVYQHNKYVGTFQPSLPGVHNVYNALGAIAVCLTLGISVKIIRHALASFKGVKRRFEHKGFINGAEIYDDYAHHPTEIAHTIEVAKKRAQNRLIVAFQPHRYTRTQKLWNNFVTTLAHCKVDILYVTDIYPANEKEIPEITGKHLVDAVKKAYPTINITYLPSCNKLKQELKKIGKKGDLILTLGAGTITNVATQLTLKEKEKVTI